MIATCGCHSARTVVASSAVQASRVTKTLLPLFAPPVMASELSFAYLKVLPVYRSFTVSNS